MDAERALAGEDPTPAEDPIAADEPAPAINAPEEVLVEKPAAELPHADVVGGAVEVDGAAVAASPVAAADVDSAEKHVDTGANTAEQQEQEEPAEAEQGSPEEVGGEQHGDEAQAAQQGEEAQQQEQRQPRPDYGPEEWETMEICEEWLPCPIVRVSPPCGMMRGCGMRACMRQPLLDYSLSYNPRHSHIGTG